MIFRMALRRRCKTWDFRGVFREDFEGDLVGDLERDFKQDMEGDLLSSSGQLRSRSGLVQVWFSLQPKFNSFELDSEVGRLVCSDSLISYLQFCAVPTFSLLSALPVNSQCRPSPT